MSFAAPTSHFYVSGRLKLHYCTWGDPALPPMMLVHGMQDHSRTWDWVVRNYVDRFFIIAPDLRGHGDSAWSNGGTYHLMDYVNDLVVLVQHLGLRDLTLVGHSLGGTLTVIQTAICPQVISKLVCIEGIGVLPEDEPNQSVQDQIRSWIASQDAQVRHERVSAIARMRKMNPGLSADQAGHLCLHGLRRNDDATLSWKFDPYTVSWPAFGLSKEQILSLYEDVACPTLLINAAEGYDHRVGQNSTLKYFANARLETIENAGHWTYHDQLDDVLGSIDRFFDIG